MRTFLITLIAILVLALLIFALVVFGPLKQFLPQSSQRGVEVIRDYFVGDRGPVTGTTSGGEPTAGSGAGPAGPLTLNTWVFPSTNGPSISVAPFKPSGATSSPQTGTSTPPSESFMLVGSSTELSPYVISYSAYDQSFTITLLKEPLKDMRIQAQQEFQKLLNVNENEACRLKYVVNTPGSVNNFYANKNLGFSFCPGATPL